MENMTLELLERNADELLRRRMKTDAELRQWETQCRTLRETFFAQHKADADLRRQVLELLDTQDTLAALQQRFYFHLGLQMGREVGTLQLRQPE